MNIFYSDYFGAWALTGYFRITSIILQRLVEVTDV